MGCATSTNIDNTEAEKSINNNNININNSPPHHVRGSATAFHHVVELNEEASPHALDRRERVTNSQLLATTTPDHASWGTITAQQVGRTHHPDASEDMLVSATSAPAKARAEPIPSLPLFGSKSSEPRLPVDEADPSMNHHADGAASEPSSSVAEGSSMPVVHVSMESSLVSHAAGGGGASLVSTVDAGGSSVLRRHNRQPLIVFDQHHQLHNFTSIFGCSDLLAPSLPRGSNTNESSGTLPVGQSQNQQRHTCLRLSVAQPPSLGGSFGSVISRVSAGGDDPHQQSPRRLAGHNARRRVQGRWRSDSSVRATDAAEESDNMRSLILDQHAVDPLRTTTSTTAVTPPPPPITSHAELDPSQHRLLQSQSLIGDGSASAWFMDDMSRLAIAVRNEEHEETLLWYEHEGEGGASTAE